MSHNMIFTVWTYFKVLVVMQGKNLIYVTKYIFAIEKQQARKPRSYASLKLRPTYWLTRVKSRATSVAKKTKSSWWAPYLRYTGRAFGYMLCLWVHAVHVSGISSLCTLKVWSFNWNWIPWAPPSVPSHLQLKGTKMSLKVLLLRLVDKKRWAGVCGPDVTACKYK